MQFWTIPGHGMLIRESANEPWRPYVSRLTESRGQPKLLVAPWPWCDEIRRLHKQITGKDIWAGAYVVGKGRPLCADWPTSVEMNIVYRVVDTPEGPAGDAGSPGRGEEGSL
jgi:hypothetical protein